MFCWHRHRFRAVRDLIAACDNRDQAQSFCRKLGGKQIHEQSYNNHFGDDLHVVGVRPYAREALGAARPIETLSELKGKKTRSLAGLAAEGFHKDCKSIETGLVDAAGASPVVSNEAFGLHKIATNPVCPAIYSQAVRILLSMPPCERRSANATRCCSMSGTRRPMMISAARPISKTVRSRRS
ncbi:MAG: hypothetical protein NXH97_13320 [Rhodobacteraceae bacterium]|nr:hypothetical protein [Paracoccaceae bacterium]